METLSETDLIELDSKWPIIPGTRRRKTYDELSDSEWFEIAWFFYQLDLKQEQAHWDRYIDDSFWYWQNYMNS